MTEVGPRPSGRRRGWIVFWVLLGVAVLALASGVVTVYLTGRAFTEPSTSMENTVRPGDIVIAAHTTHVHRGDVIVAQQTSPAPGDYLRRVIGLPGDHVACCAARGRITVNGKPLYEPYVYPGNAPSAVRFQVIVPKGHLWLMGDHRLISYDSRELGPLAVRVVGRAVLVLQGGHPVLLRMPQAFITDGLTPAGEGTPPVLAGLALSILAWLLIIALVVIGVVCFVIGKIRRRRQPKLPSAPVYGPATPPSAHG